jgi:diamine N-acetyltransferase
MRPQVTLEEVDADNWRACTALEVGDEQREFVAPVSYYLALCAYGDRLWQPLAVRARDEVIGFVMWARDSADESFWIGGLLVDRCHQRHGYGREVVRQLLGRAAADGYASAALSYDPRNSAARALYAGLGFQETGEFEGSETVARRTLAADR